MSRSRKRTRKQLKHLEEPQSDSDEYESINNETENNITPSKKRSKRIKNKKIKEIAAKQNMFSITDYDYNSIIIICPKDYKPSNKIAAFDMDWTLVRPPGKNKFPTNRKDWIWMYRNVPSKLKELHVQGFRIVLISNQNGIGTGKTRRSDIVGKIIDLSEELEIPLTGILSTQKDIFRKPGTRMWDYFVQEWNGNTMENDANEDSDIDENIDNNNSSKEEIKESESSVDLQLSFYVGDAAGRPAKWRDSKTKKDFSCSDRKFAVNIGIPFHTPEAFFLGEKENQTWDWRSINPKEILTAYPESLSEETEKWFHGSLPIARSSLDMVIMSGFPGSGKSTFCRRFLLSEGYEWINRDTYKTQAKCKKYAAQALAAKKNVVIDNTNPNSTAREGYIALGRKYKANVRIFVMNCSKELALHLNLYREQMSDGEYKRVPGLVFNIHAKKVRVNGEIVAEDEDVDEVCTIDFIPWFDGNEQSRQMFAQFT